MTRPASLGTSVEHDEDVKGVSAMQRFALCHAGRDSSREEESGGPAAAASACGHLSAQGCQAVQGCSGSWMG